MISVVTCFHSAKLCAYAAQEFRSQYSELGTASKGLKVIKRMQSQLGSNMYNFFNVLYCSKIEMIFLILI